MDQHPSGPHGGSAGPGPAGDVAVVIPARNEAARLAATVGAARRIPGVDLVVVVDDGSADATRQVAQQAGAAVASHSRSRGKAAAMETGAAAVIAADRTEGRRQPRHLLFLDADLEDSAANAAPLVQPVRSGEADMTIAILPPQRRAGGGFGLVVNLSRSGILRATGFTPTQPLSGQRCLTRAAFCTALPLAGGFGVETGLTIDLLRHGLRVREVEIDLHHRVTGRDLGGWLHRGTQYVDVARALGVRMLPDPVRRRVRR